MKKQQELQRKLELAKQQRQAADSSTSSSSTLSEPTLLTPEERKAENDRKQFQKLLDSESATLSHMNEYEGKSYLTKAQEEEELMSMNKGMNRLFEYDNAPTEPFEELISMKTENALGKYGVDKKIPWLKNKQDYMIVFCDPREKSMEFRQLMRTIVTSIPNDIQKRITFINADSPAENRRFTKKNNVSFTIYSDENREWMKSYTALGDKRWSITFFILAEGRIQKLVRDFDTEIASTIISNAIQSYKAS